MSQIGSKAGKEPQHRSPRGARERNALSTSSMEEKF